MMIDVWDRILSNLEDCRAATILTSVDYSKAFNRLSFQHCLRAFEAHGASSPVLSLLATFLTNRTMSVRVGQSWSTERQVNGGVPQGSILGVFLFNVSIDDLEDGCPDVDGEVVEPSQLGGLPHSPLPDTPDQSELSPTLRRSSPGGDPFCLLYTSPSPRD